MKNKTNYKIFKNLKETMLEKSPDVKKVDTSKLLENITTAIEAWGKACVDQDEIPVCIGSFVSIDTSDEKSFEIKHVMLGEIPEVVNLLECIKKNVEF